MQYIKEQEYSQRKEISFLHKLQSPNLLAKVHFS